MNEDDIDDLIRQLDPARGEPVARFDSEAGRLIRERALRSGARRRPGRRLVAAIAALVLLCGGTAAAVLLRSSAPVEARPVVCYAAADLSARALDAGGVASLNPSSCSPLWHDGTFGDGTAVPSLVPCVLDGGGVGVFPGDEQVCATLGLDLAVDLATLDPLVLLTRQIGALTPPGECADFDASVRAARVLVRDAALSGWTLEVGSEATAERPCASFAVDAGRRTVTAVPIPDLS